MMHSLSVVMPVHNEAAHLAETIDALVEAVVRSGLVAELVLVDDGSTDDSADVAGAALNGRLPLRVLSRKHSGRFRARQAGVEVATAEWVLLLDARVRLHPESLRFVSTRLNADLPVWNGHVVPQTRGNPFGAFGNVVVHIAWREYFHDPRTTSFGLESFDHFPKGTGCFLAPTALLVESMDQFDSRVSDLRFVSDDTHLIRWIASRHRIQISPEFGCDYQPRATFSAFLENAVYRGSTFVDGHGRRESRFFPIVISFFPVSAVLAVLVLRRPRALPFLVVTTVVGAAILGSRARRPTFETLSFAVLAPVYAVGHGLGMWRGLWLRARDQLAAML